MKISECLLSDEYIALLAADCERIADDGRQAKDFVQAALFRARGSECDPEDEFPWTGLAWALHDMQAELRASAEFRELIQRGYDPESEVAILAGSFAAELKRAAELATPARVYRMAEQYAGADGGGQDAEAVRDWLRFLHDQITTATFALSDAGQNAAIGGLPLYANNLDPPGDLENVAFQAETNTDDCSNKTH